MTNPTAMEAVPQLVSLLCRCSRRKSDAAQLKLPSRFLGMTERRRRPLAAPMRRRTNRGRFLFLRVPSRG